MHVGYSPSAALQRGNGEHGVSQGTWKAGCCLSAPGNTGPIITQPQSPESAFLFQRQKTNGPGHSHAAGVAAKPHWNLPNCLSTLFIRHLKMFLQEKEASGLRNDSLLNMVQLHRTLCGHARLQLKPEGE